MRTKARVRVLNICLVLVLMGLFAVGSAFAVSAPSIVTSEGYLNGTPLAIHTSGSFNSTGASTLVLFVSTITPWNAQPVSINAITDSAGNTWTALVGPTLYGGTGTFPLLSGIYYVNGPTTSSSHTVTATLSNGAPLVMHVFAVRNSSTCSPPIFSAITNPGATGASDVVTADISVGADTLLLAWVKNETAASAIADDSWTLDSASVSYLWPEYETATVAGSYHGHFTYSSAIGWQTAVIGIKPIGPCAQSLSVSTKENIPVGVTLVASSPNGPVTYSIVTSPSHGAMSGTAPNLTYTPTTNYVGPDFFTYNANDGTSDSNLATVSISVRSNIDTAPVANNANVTTAEATPVAIQLIASDQDLDPLLYSVVNLPTHGTLSGPPPFVTYTPAAAFLGSDSFTFKANDGTFDSNIATVTITVMPPAPTIVARTGYINSNPQTTHTTNTFNSTGATVLVAFVSSHTPWNSLPVSITSVTDNVNNSWTLLTGPTLYGGTGTFPLLSAIYYVNAPATSTVHAVTATLSNPAPLVMHIFAIRDSDTSQVPVSSTITDPGATGASDVVSGNISVPIDTLLLAWVKNETAATASARDSWTLDSASTNYLWAEYETASAAGSYHGHFTYDSAIGWQTAAVGIKPVPPPPGAQSFTVSAPASAISGTPFNFTVKAVDASNNTVTGYNGTVHFSSSDALASLPADTTLVNGTGTFNATLNTLGSQTITASDTVTSSITGTSGTIAVGSSAATHFAVSAPASATAGTAFNYTVIALDSSNNTAVGYSGTVHFSSSDAQAILPANTTLVNGTGSFSATLKTNGSQTITATDTVTSSITGTSGTIAVGSGTATHFAVTAPASATAGTAFNFTVTALDSSNNTAVGYSGTVHFSSSDAQAILPANTTLVNGTGSFSATLKTAGSQTITATDTVSSIAGASGTIAVSAGTATHFAVSAPASTTAGSSFNFTVTAQDQFNNIATGYSGTVHFSSSDAQAILPANTTLVNGTRTFSTTLRTAGNQAITATDTVTSSITGTSGTIAVSPGAATHFAVSAPASATAGTAFNFTVTALDSSNNTAVGYSGTVHFSSSDAQAILPANTTLVNGTGSFSATLSTNGSQTITATDTVMSSISGTSGAIAVSPGLLSLTLTPSSVGGGSGSTGTVTMTARVNGNSTVITLASNNPALASVPTSVTVPNKSSSANFSISTSGVLVATQVTITATYKGATLKATLTLMPPALSSLTLSPTTVVGPNPSTGTVQLNGVAPAGGATINLSSASDTPGVATVPATISVPAGSTSTTFTVSTSSVTSPATVTISASFNGGTPQTAMLIVSPGLSGVAVSPNSVKGGTSTTGTVTLVGPAPAGEAVVALSDNSGKASVPSSVTIAAGHTTATFTINTSKVKSTTSVTVSASYGGTTKTTTLTITP